MSTFLTGDDGNMALAMALATPDFSFVYVIDEASKFPPPSMECSKCLPWDTCTCAKPELTEQAKLNIKKAEEKRERKNLKRLLETKRDIIHRCGWCGYPVREDGSFIPGICVENVNQYLDVNAGAEEHLVNGVCCPKGQRGGE